MSEPDRWPEFMTVPTAARYLDISEASIRKLVRLENLPMVVVVGRARRIPRAALDECLEKKLPAAPEQVVPGLRVSRSGRSPW